VPNFLLTYLNRSDRSELLTITTSTAYYFFTSLPFNLSFSRPSLFIIYLCLIARYITSTSITLTLALLCRLPTIWDENNQSIESRCSRGRRTSARDLIIIYCFRTLTVGGRAEIRRHRVVISIVARVSVTPRSDTTLLNAFPRLLSFRVSIARARTKRTIEGARAHRAATDSDAYAIFKSRAQSIF